MKQIRFIIGLLFLALLGGYGYYRFFLYEPPAIRPDDRATLTLMPLPAKLRLQKGELPLPERWTLRFTAHREERLERAAARLTERLSREAGMAITLADDGGFPLTIRCAAAAGAFPREREEESYELRVTRRGATITAASPYGVLHALETLAQLPRRDAEGAPSLPLARVEDAPRYTWRGLMLDAGRHWMPPDVVRRTLDAMAAAKLNVLHWHLSEYQAFRVESRVFPKLHELGSRGDYYTQDDIRALVAYAADRGIRVVPEFDLPGHATSWFVGYPDLASAPGPYRLDDRFGVLTPVMDPTREEVYDFLDRFFGEMAALFSDPFIHIGGDEVVARDWERNPAIQAFMKEKGLRDAHDLQAYFNRRMEAILQRHGKRMAGWDEILHPGLGDGVVVQSWRSQRSLFEAVRQGGRAILSAGYYLDHKRPAADHYRVDPEVLPGAVDIEPDSSHWQIWQLHIEAMGTVLEPRLVLFGPAPKQRGFLDLMGNMNGFSDAVREGDDLSFSFLSDYGNISFQGTVQGDSLQGKLGLGFLSMPVGGRQVGGPGIAGSEIPRYERVKPLTGTEKARILGGEACMWSELVDARTVESRIWPRAAAIAERLWSPATLTSDVDDMYRRLDAFDDYLDRQGSRHRSYRADLLRDLAGGGAPEAMATLVDALEEVKYYDRMAIYGDTLTVHTPLDRLVDAAAPESRPARRFAAMVEAFLAGDRSRGPEVEAQLAGWRAAAEQVLALPAPAPRQQEVQAVAARFRDLSTTALEALSTIDTNTPVDHARRTQWLAALDAAAQPEGGVLIAPAPAARRLVERALAEKQNTD